MKLDVDLHAPVYLLKGGDDVLLEDNVVELVHGLVGDEDRTLVVEELDAARYENDSGDYQIGVIVDAAQTPPFLTSRRVVVARQAGVWSRQEQVQPLIDYLAQPLDTTSLVLVWEKSPKAGASLQKLPAKLNDAIKKAGGITIEAAAPGGKGRASWIEDQIKHAGIKLDAAARAMVEERIGEDAGLLVGLLPTLEAVYGAGAKIGVDELEPYLFAEGGAKPWDLTDAIDNGDVATAMAVLQRMLATSHPLMIMGSLNNHFGRMLALDGAGVGTDKQAAELLGMKGSTYPAKKALDQANRLGSERLADFIGLLAQADLDMKGAKAWDAQLVAEVLVARLASRTPKRRGRR